VTFLNVTEIESALIALNTAYPALTQVLLLPNVTYEGRQSRALLIRGNSGFTCRPALVFISGAHAREWGGPDILVNLATDLLEAYTANAGLAYGNKSFSAAEIRQIVDRTDVVVFPDINPDGRAYSMAARAGSTQAMWRKNRNPASSGGAANAIGVDVNRNYDFLWNFPVTFAPNAVPPPASTDPTNDVFFGTGPFSEPESRNVLWLVDQFPNARWFLDVHSFTGRVLHPWGDDENQTTDSSKSFKNTAWDGKRGVAGDAYGEFVGATRLAQLQAAGGAMRDAIYAVRGESYVSQSGFDLYPTSGTSEDWAFTREFLNPSRGPLSGFVIEFNKDIDFFPTWGEMQKLIADVDAGLVALCVRARPGLLLVILCWFRVRFWAIWHRVFPPELWGPYGPWRRIVPVVGAMVAGIVAAVVTVVRAIGRRGR
jgi:murein tripeptide amidase MpaA